ncbi:MAG: NAD(P)/FAD-dependent oxidoreductase [Pseudomonadota bacterium]
MSERFDVVIVGAGFAGLYMLHQLRQRNLSVCVFEQGDSVGGTWYWNRYPGARCDAESLAYSFSFSAELEQQWQWSERYATQPEILRYAEHVADHFKLRSHIRFQQKVSQAHYDDADNLWHVQTAQGQQVAAQFCIMATGCLSVPQLPAIDGVESFAGPVYQASKWPPEGVDFTGKTVGIIGTGSSGIQAIPVIAEQAEHLYVFQRTPNFSVPAQNAVLDQSWVEQFKANYRQHREYHKKGLSSGFGDLEIEPRERTPMADTAQGMTAAEVADVLEPYWQRGGAFFLSAFADSLANPETNKLIADYVRNKIRTIVQDPQTAEDLCPTDHPIGSKRICVDTNYYATYNRDNVSLVNVRRTPLQQITATGLQTSERDYNFDVLVLATGFDAMTGALLNMDIRGADGQLLRDKWAAGPRSYLGIGLHGFPNLFTVTGPGSPSVLSNMLVSIEQHVDWMVACLDHMREHGHQRVEALLPAEDQWVNHVNEVANATLFPEGGSWYLGANVAGKPRVFMPYAAGVGPYREICDDVVADNYRGFAFS